MSTSSSNNKEVENVSKRVKNTKKEIELLKAELEKLIHSGVQSGTKDTKTVAQTAVTQPEPTYRPQVIKKNVEPPQKKPEPTKDSSAKKVRNYNVEEAKEYIKKQKEKRAEQLKAQINVADNKLDLKKQKLKELHQKTLELVTKNVQLKRERSKSRDGGVAVRPDKVNPRQKSQEKGSQENLKLTSQDRFNKGSQEKLRQDRFKGSREDVRQKSQDRLNKGSQENLRPRSQDRFKKGSQETFNKFHPKAVSRPQNKQKSPLQEKAATSNLRAKSQERIADVKTAPSQGMVSGRVSRSRTRVEKPKPVPVPPIGVTKIDPNLLYPSNFKLKKTDNLDTTFDKTVLPPFEENDENKTRRQNTLLEHSIMTDACLKDTKETQTSQGGNFGEPIWLKPPPALPYPYNFINTVKRKLQCAVNSPRSCVDVGVQNSEGASSRTPEPERAKSKDEIKELLIKSAASELKSFASHRCPNLDLEAVENLELIPHNNSKKTKIESVPKNLFADYDSESDTSKNIPEISSESHTSSHKNDQGGSEPVLSLDKLKDLKLHPHNLASPKLSSSRIKTDTNGYPEWHNDTYTFDFAKESDLKSKSSGSSIKTVTSERNQIGSSAGSSSSIKTVASEKKESSEFVIQPNNSSQDSRSSTDRFQDQRGEDELTFKSLLTKQSSKSATASVSEVSNTVSKPASVDGLALKEPTISLSYKKDERNSDPAKSKMKNITIRPALSTNNNANEIHLKFEAEVRLLNDFNESLKQFMTVEKAFESLKNDSNVAMTKVLQNVDTQTSVVTKTSTVTADGSPKTINFSRGSELIEELNDSVVSNNRDGSKSTFSTEWDLSRLNGSSITNKSAEEEKRMKLSMSNVENYNMKSCAGLSLNMFEQLIKDEDARIKHLKAIIKIREQALLDRTKGELVWLEIQKKQLIETGKTEEASLLKKKQRGIILKHEQERNEIKKLKQMQKEESEERKNILKQQRNLIKSQLSTKNMLSKIKVKTPRERRSSGPLRVVQSCSESIHSETSISRRSSAFEDVLSVTSHSVRFSEIESELDLSGGRKEDAAKVPVSNVKRTLFMREAALQKRRKTAEELLRWHRKLLDEERKIAELEAAATSVMTPKEPARYKFNGRQLNQLWRNMTGRDDRKFAEDKVYIMSQIALERLCKCARQHSNKNRKAHTRNSDVATERSVVSETEKSDSDCAKKTKVASVRSEEVKAASEVNYSSLFDPESVQEIINSQEEKTKISSISELIDNFSRIEDEISLLSRKSEHDITSLKENVEAVPRGESKNTEVIEDFDSVLSQPLSKSSSQASVQEISVLKTMTPNHVSEPEENRSDEIQSEKTESKTKNEEIASIYEDKTSQEVETSNRQVTEIESAISSEREEPEAEHSREEVSYSPKETEPPTAEESSTPETEVSEKISTEETDKVSTEEIQKVSIKETEIGETEKISVEEIEKVSTEETEKVSTEETKKVSTEEIEKVSIEETEKVSTEETKKVSTEETEKVYTEETEKVSEEETQNSEETENVSAEETEKVSIEETEKVPTEELSSAEEVQEVATEKSSFEEETSESTISSKDLALDETLESASKIEESLMKLNEQLSSEKNNEILEAASKLEESLVKLSEKLKKDEEISEDVRTEDSSTSKEVQSIEETRSAEISPKSSSASDEKSPQKKGVNQIDVKKRVSEILADANGHRGDKSPRVQDLYVTAYDVGSSNSSEFIESFENGRPLPTDIFGSEAEELWRKQLAIEQEIKQLEQQQKEQLPYVFMREIPNKPPPPYTPPLSVPSLPQSILPTNVKEVNEISDYSSKVLYKAYLNDNLEKVKFSENGFKLFSKVEVASSCAEFVFNLCRDIARDHYKQFEKVEEPSWLMLTKKPQLAKSKPPDAAGLDKVMNRKVRELLGFKKQQAAESAIMKWGRKKRDHVDEVLVVESQEEESQWTNFDSDELIVKDQITADIMKMLVAETANTFSKILSKKRSCVS